MSRGTVGARTIRCPGCGGPSVYAADNPHRPFRSARCKNNDFGAWAREAFAEQADPEPDADAPETGTGRPDPLPH